MHSKMGNLHSKVKLFVPDSDFIFGNLYRVYITLCETMQDTKEATKKEKNTAMEQLFIQTAAVMKVGTWDTCICAEISTNHFGFV